MRLFIFFYIHRIQESFQMVKGKGKGKLTRRYNKSRAQSRSKSQSRSRSRSRSRSIMGGSALVGSSWSPATNNTYAALTAPRALGNHFQLSQHGSVVGGIQPAVPEMNGPAIWQQNLIKGGKSRRKRGGELLAGFPSLVENVWNNTQVAISNIAKGFDGKPQLPPATPWDQPKLHTQYNATFRPIPAERIASLRAAAG